MVVGGAVTFVNPEPLALFADVIAAGEGEMLIPALVRRIREARIVRTCSAGWRRSAGFYIPSFYDVHYADDGTIAGFRGRSRAQTRRR